MSQGASPIANGKDSQHRLVRCSPDRFVCAIRCIAGPSSARAPFVECILLMTTTAANYEITKHAKSAGPATDGIVISFSKQWNDESAPTRAASPHLGAK